MWRKLLDKSEVLLKPTKARRYIAILLYMAYLGGCAYLEYHFLDATRPIRVKYPQTVIPTRWFTSIALFLRILSAAICYGGLFHARITPWTFGSTFSTISTILVICACLTDLTYSVDDIYKIVSETLFLEIILYCAGMAVIVIVSYYTLTTMESHNAKLDLDDPQKAFATRLLQSIVNVLPGLGFASKHIMRMAKAD
ncbi:hypothetical protein WA158_000126 [Blastocystis sp. Blastoise]